MVRTMLAIAAALTAGFLLGHNNPQVQRVQVERPLVVQGCGGYSHTQTK